MRLVNEYNTEMGGQRPVFASHEDAELDMLDGISYACANSDGFPTSTYIDLETRQVYAMTITCKLEPIDGETLADSFWQDIAEEFETAHAG